MSCILFLFLLVEKNYINCTYGINDILLGFFCFPLIAIGGLSVIFRGSLSTVVLYWTAGQEERLILHLGHDHSKIHLGSGPV